MIEGTLFWNVKFSWLGECKSGCEEVEVTAIEASRLEQKDEVEGESEMVEPQEKCKNIVKKIAHVIGNISFGVPKDELLAFLGQNSSSMSSAKLLKIEGEECNGNRKCFCLNIDKKILQKFIQIEQSS